ncbi:MAG TPA: hypothetical protein VGF30_14445 [Bacteroidia bacterium]
MKKTLLLLSTLICSLMNAQKLDLGINYNADIPFAADMPKMNMNHGAGLYIGYKVLEKTPLWFSADLSTGMYAYKSRKETYRFTDGTETETWVNYSSNLHKLLFGFNYDIGRSENLFSGYLTAQAGYAIMNSKIFIEDPSEPDGCKALVNKNTLIYGNGIYAGGAGVRININQLQKKQNKYGFNQHIEIGVKYTGGGNFNYVNIKHMQEHNHAIAGSASTSTNADTRDLTVKFVNVTTNDIHEHKVAEVYTSPFKMLNLKVGYMVRF